MIFVEEESDDDHPQGIRFAPILRSSVKTWFKPGSFGKKMWQDAKILKQVVFVTRRDYLPNTMLVAQEGAAEISFRLQLGEVEAESLTLTNGKLLKEQQKCGLNALTIPPCGPGRLCKVSAAFYMFNLF